MVTLSPRVRSLGVGYGLGVAGAVLAIVLAFPAVLALDALGVASVSVRLAALFVFGQYLPFMAFPLLYLRWRGFDWAGVREYLGVRVPSLKEVGVVGAGFLAVFALTLGMTLLITEVLGLPTAENSTGQLAQELPRIIPLLVVASIVVIGPCEETLFRGAVHNRLREAFDAPAAVVLSSALFAAIHVTALTGSLGARLTTIVILFVPSLVFGTVYEYTDNLVVPALIHGLWDAFLFTAIYVTVVYGPGMSQAVLPL
ncbi:CPBP family intramembrane glutamic endopeptidase [Halobaculum sp. P14]|uniref:CPBP family intramembrane glutamic endopeptidase n=1 Tax=Halobaculum sp. P14 TaxID=3421638 RepID=UPI003EBDC293